MQKKVFCFLILLFSLSVHGQTDKDTLQVYVYDSPPFGMTNSKGEVSGLMVELWEDIAKDLDFNYEYTLTDLDHILKALNDGNADVGLGAISITPHREELVDFSHAVNPSGTGIAISRKMASTSRIKKWGPIFINLIELVTTLVLMLFLSAFIVFIVEKKHSKDNPSENSISSLSDGLWWAAVTMTTVGYGDKVPRSAIGKFSGILWIFVGIIFFSLFTANTSAELAKHRLSSQINTVEDLHKVKVVAVESSSGEEFLIREHVDYYYVDNIEEAIDEVLSGRAKALVSNVPVLKYHNKMNYPNELLISDKYLLRNNMGIAFPTNSSIKEEVNIILLEKISESKWQNALYKYIGE